MQKSPAVEPLLKEDSPVVAVAWPDSFTFNNVFSDSSTPLSESNLSKLASFRKDLPSNVYEALASFTENPNDVGALVLKNVPVGSIPPTPPSPTAKTGKNLASETLLLTLARCLGHPVGYAPEHGGDLVQNIVPVASTADRQVSTSSKVRLEFHTEAAFHPHRPRYLLLMCLRGDVNASTTLCSVRHALKHIPFEVQEVLKQPRFATGVDESYLGFRSDNLGPSIPAVSGPHMYESICFDGDLMQGLDPEATDALEMLRAAIDKAQCSLVLEAGDVLIVDNQIAVHGRSPFTPRFDGTDRWLQRSFVVADLSSSANDRVGRIIATSFKG
jgi:alpha-ketoglutarate-dependent taurine dioxygenase